MKTPSIVPTRLIPTLEKESMCWQPHVRGCLILQAASVLQRAADMAQSRSWDEPETRDLAELGFLLTTAAFHEMEEQAAAQRAKPATPAGVDSKEWEEFKAFQAWKASRG